MSVRRQRGAWMVDVDIELPDGTRFPRVRKISPVQTRRGAENYERELRDAILGGAYGAQKREVCTFEEWFNGRFWKEWVIGRRNKPSEVESKKSIYKHHLGPTFGSMALDQIGTAEIAEFRANLVARGMVGEKRINNILTVLSKALNYAADAEVIPRAPKVGLLKVERPEIVSWEFEQYASILRAAADEGAIWYAAACLAGEAGLRIGEVRALRWREDVDLLAGTITVNQQARHGVVGTPKGRTRRTVPMTATLTEALKRLDVVRTGYVVRNLDGTPMTDGQTTHVIYRICDGAGLTAKDHPKRSWHVLRHSFGTHAALFGVNPWRLQTWLGHKSITETMLYVHVADAHKRPIPPEVTEAAKDETDADRRIVRMLGARVSVRPSGNLTATTPCNSLQTKVTTSE